MFVGFIPTSYNIYEMSYFVNCFFDFFLRANKFLRALVFFRGLVYNNMIGGK